MSEKQAELELTVSKGSGGTIILVPTIKDAKELIRTIAEDIGLKPKRGDLMVYADKKGNLKPYITKSGYAQLAYNQKVSTKTEIVKQKITHPYFVMVKCTATDAHGTFHEEFGACDSNEMGRQQKPFSTILGMAITRARNRALNFSTRGYNCAYEELDPKSEEFKNAIDVSELVEKEED